LARRRAPVAVAALGLRAGLRGRGRAVAGAALAAVVGVAGDARLYGGDRPLPGERQSGHARRPPAEPVVARPRAGGSLLLRRHPRGRPGPRLLGHAAVPALGARPGGVRGRAVLRPVGTGQVAGERAGLGQRGVAATVGAAVGRPLVVVDVGHPRGPPPGRHAPVGDARGRDVGPAGDRVAAVQAGGGRSAGRLPRRPGRRLRLGVPRQHGLPAVALPASGPVAGALAGGTGEGTMSPLFAEGGQWWLAVALMAAG